MKKTYETPEVEKIAFQYRDQVVVASGTPCYVTAERDGNQCISDQPTYTK